MLMDTRAGPQGRNQLVELRQAGIRRSGRWLVRGVDLSIGRGEILTLIGPNGAGKSTTAKLVTGVLRADEGTVQRAEDLRIGYVPQKLSIDWTMPLTVRRLMHLTGRLADDDLTDALSATGIAHLIEAEVRHLSGGEFQRALLARAIARKPDLQRLFGGNARGLAVYSHRHDHTHLDDGRVLHGDGSITDHCHPGDGHHDHDHHQEHDHHGHDHHGHDHATPAGEGNRHA